MSATEERKALIDGAAALQADLQKLTSRIHAVINKMLGEADLLMVEAADERNTTEVIKTTKLKYGGTGAVPDAPLLPAGKRKCGTCGELGHNARTCPKANEKYKADRAPKKKGKKK